MFVCIILLVFLVIYLFVCCLCFVYFDLVFFFFSRGFACIFYYSSGILFLVLFCYFSCLWVRHGLGPNKVKCTPKIKCRGLTPFDSKIKRIGSISFIFVGASAPPILFRQTSGGLFSFFFWLGLFDYSPSCQCVEA